jgi:hypothetical protein
VRADLNLGVEERHVAEPLAERDALVDDAEHIEGGRVRYYYYYHYARAAAAVVRGALRRFLSYSVWKKNQVVGCIIVFIIIIIIMIISNDASGAFASASSSYLFIITNSFIGTRTALMTMIIMIAASGSDGIRRKPARGLDPHPVATAYPTKASTWSGPASGSDCIRRKQARGLDPTRVR